MAHAVRSVLTRPCRKRKAAEEGAGVEFKHVESSRPSANAGNVFQKGSGVGL